MRGRGIFQAFIGALCFLCGQESYAQDNEASLSWVPHPRISGDLRLRYQDLKRDDFDQDGQALTLRFKGNAEFDIFTQTTFLGEVEGNLALISEFDDGSNGQSNFPFIPDPEGVELNRLQITTQIIPKTRVTLGRQRIALDDWRFIGSFPFRQNDQTFDALRVETRKFGPGILDVGYFNKVLGPLGRDNVRGTFEGDSVFAHYNFATLIGRVSAFHYSLGLESGPKGPLRQDASTNTTGLRVLGRRDGDELSIAWQGSYAKQSDRSDNPKSYSAEYALAEISINPGKVTLKGRVEILGSDNGYSLQTPLASLHRFQGLADQFLQTPPDGLRDFSVFIGYDFGDIGPFQRVTSFARHHWFHADVNRRAYGDELNLSLSGKINNVGMSLEFANYRAENFSDDNQALFISSSFSF